MRGCLRLGSWPASKPTNPTHSRTHAQTLPNVYFFMFWFSREFLCFYLKVSSVLHEKDHPFIFQIWCSICVLVFCYPCGSVLSQLSCLYSGDFELKSRPEYPLYWGYLWFFSVRSGRFWDNACDDRFFPHAFTTLFINDPVIGSYILWANVSVLE
jgi:hypothetical protein